MTASFYFLLFYFLSSSVFGDVMDQVQKSWSKTTSYKARFHQTIISKALGTRDETRGTLFVQKPLRLRWQSESGDSIQILNGSRFWQIKTHKRKKTVYVDYYPNISSLVNLGSLTFLADSGDIKKTYRYKVLQNTTKNVIVALAPKGQKQESILAEFLKPGYLLGALKQESLESETQINFHDVETNLSLESSLFEYKAGPKDIVVNHE